MIKFIIFIVVASLLLACGHSAPENHSTQVFIPKKDTTPFISPASQQLGSASAPSVLLIDPKFAFSHILYGKYIVIGRDIPANMFSGKYVELKSEQGYVLECEIAKGKATKEMKAFLNQEFYCMAHNDSVYQYKIKKIKIILHGTPHFGTVSEAKQDSSKAYKAIFEMMLKNGAAYLVGEIETERTNLLWARSIGLKKYIAPKELPHTPISKKDKHVLARALSLPYYFIDAESFMKTKDLNYFLVTRNRTTSDCGGPAHAYRENMICTLNNDGRVNCIASPKQDELLYYIDIDNDGKLIFVFMDRISKSIYMIDPFSKAPEGFRDIYLPFNDCPC